MSALFLLVFATTIILIALFRSLSNDKNKNVHDFLENLEKPKPTYQPSPTYQTKAQKYASLDEHVRTLPEAKVEYVVDGDTVIVSSFFHKKTIRLDSIDCPEDGQYWGDTAKYGLMKLIVRRKVRLEEHGTDHYGRTLATIYVKHGYGNDWINVNERMVMLGHAWVMHKFYNHLPAYRQDQLSRLERWARSKKVGLWKAANPIPPWRWRKNEGSE